MASALFFASHLLYCPSLRISLPKSRSRAEVKEGGMKKTPSVEQLDVDLDRISQGSSEASFNYEYAQAEVMMKGLKSDGESYRGVADKKKECLRNVI